MSEKLEFILESLILRNFSFSRRRLDRLRLLVVVEFSQKFDVKLRTSLWQEASLSRLIKVPTRGKLDFVS